VALQRVDQKLAPTSKILLAKVVESLKGAVYLRIWHATSDYAYYAFDIQCDRGPQKDQSPFL
jgi:hypothetical protein